MIKDRLTTGKHSFLLPESRCDGLRAALVFGAQAWGPFENPGRNNHLAAVEEFQKTFRESKDFFKYTQLRSQLDAASKELSAAMIETDRLREVLIDDPSSDATNAALQKAKERMTITQQRVDATNEAIGRLTTKLKHAFDAAVRQFSDQRFIEFGKESDAVLTEIVNSVGELIDRLFVASTVRNLAGSPGAMPSFEAMIKP